VSKIQGEGLKYDAGKPRPGLIPATALDEAGKVLAYGAIKYKPNSWQNIPHAKERYLDALLRHIIAYMSGEVVDEESGLHHMSHAMVNCMFLIQLNKEDSNE